MSVRRVLFAASALAAAAFFSPLQSHAQEYPSKPVKVLIGFASGGPTDLIGRIMAEHLSKSMGQPFIVESKPGASGVVAGQALLAAPADGYTIYVVSFGVIATAKAMMASMTYDPAVEFAPISMLVKSALIVEVSTKTPVKTWAEFLPWAKANSGKLNHGSPGVGTQPHLAAELLRQRFGFDSQHIAYRGTGPFMQGMTQKELEWAVDSPSGTLPLLKNGQVRALAVASETRWPDFPDVPTLTELGVADAVWPSWFGLVTRTGVPKPIIDKIAAEVAKGWKEPDNVARLRTIGYEAWATSPEETAKLFATDRERWTAVVKANNIKAE